MNPYPRFSKKISLNPQNFAASELVPRLHLYSLEERVLRQCIFFFLIIFLQNTPTFAQTADEAGRSEERAILSNPDSTLDQIDAFVKRAHERNNFAAARRVRLYGLKKTAP